MTPALLEGWQLVRRDYSALAMVLMLMLLNRASAMALPAGSRFIIDDVIGRQRMELLFPLTLVVIAATLVEAGSGFALNRLAGIVSQRAVTRLRRFLYGRILRLPTRALDEERAGALVSRVMNDPESIRDVWGPGLIQLASGTLTAAGAATVLFTVNAQLTLAVIGLLLGALVLLTRRFGRLYQVFLEIGGRTAEMTGRLAEVLGGIRVVKIYRAERREAYAFTRESHRLFRDYATAFTGASWIAAWSTVVVGAVSGVVLIAGGRAVLHGGMTLGEFVMYGFFLGLLVTPLLQIAATASQGGHAAASLGRVAQLRAVPTEDEEDGDLATVPPLTGRVVFEQVGFGYAPDRPVLRKVSFEALPGTTVAVAGPNGAGKTTLAQLLLRLRLPTEGRVVVDGHDLASVRGRDYRAQVGFVPVEPTLLDGTIAENIRYGRPGASMTSVIAAARLAHCEEFVTRLPNGYATVIGEQGRRLSGGQRQRLAIARAILGDPRILVLDEASAHLDPEADLMIQEALSAVRRGRTTFIITHRLSTVRTADQILILKGGEIVERGTHQELLAAGGWYGRLHQTGGLADGSSWRGDAEICLQELVA
jgi:subfamily B ATP-binding cassette protein MsbA